MIDELKKALDMKFHASHCLSSGAWQTLHRGMGKRLSRFASPFRGGEESMEGQMQTSWPIQSVLIPWFQPEKVWWWKGLRSRRKKP